MGVNYKKLLSIHEHFEKDPTNTPDPGKLIREGLGWTMDGKRLKDRAWKPSDFDLGRLFEECFGPGEFRACRNRERFVYEVMEAAGAVSTASFQNIVGQIIYSAIMDAYTDEEFVFAKVIPEKQSMFIHKEKIAGITQIGDAALVVPEGQQYPLAGVSETWIAWPEALKRGMIVPVTREIVFADRTGVLLDRCKDVGFWGGENKEKRIIDAIIDENGGATSAATGHRYNWRDTSIQSYGANSGTHTWNNLVTTNGLTDWTNVDSAEQLLNQMTDPDTAEPFVAPWDTLITAKNQEKAAMRILHATEIRVVSPGYATSGAPTQTVAANPYQGKFNILTSRLFYARVATKTNWYFGSPARYAIYKVIFPASVREAPPNNLDEFQRDIVRQFRFDEMGAACVVEPRYMVKSTA